MSKKNNLLKWVGILLLMLVVVNLFLAVISTVFPVVFEKPHAIIEPPEIFFTIPIGKYVLNINQTIMNTWAIMIVIILILILGTRKISVENPGFFQLVLEEYYNFINNNFLEGLGKYKEKFAGFFSALFSMILLLNVSMFLFPFVIMWKRTEHGLLIKPFFRTATADMNTTVGLAVVVFVIFIGAAIYRMGVLGFIKELSQPFVFMLPINIIGEFAKPINISMRLFGNMFAGLVIMALVYGLTVQDIFPTLTHNVFKGSFSFAVGWPNVLQVYLDFFIGILQAFVFTVLSSVYIKQMLIGEEEEEE
ncbi:F0F1 ATP synthase subunit A [Streptobacillus canis]|uniref:F0F1 ATP synthase subunit A n=1 Tax=Streptobacillus canis TaxID=2678686 RepID=UPI001E574112|nr:F0F1 ATP synthase subunit A [Streptobacillus canis]